jgi:hypothetical protein
MKQTETKEKPLCTLCKQPVEIAGFSLLVEDNLKHFCCEGCLSIYQLLHKFTAPNSHNSN